MKINLTAAGSGDEAVILKERFDNSVGRRIVGLYVPLAPAEHIFELAVRGMEGGVDCRGHVASVFSGAALGLTLMSAAPGTVK